jgi:hypothetical protein
VGTGPNWSGVPYQAGHPDDKLPDDKLIATMKRGAYLIIDRGRLADTGAHSYSTGRR